MCRAITCTTCHRPTWAGCGAHVEQVLGHVPPAERCRCNAKQTAPKQNAPKQGWLQRRRAGR